MNLPTFIVAAIVAILFLAIVVKGIQNKKNGKGGCSCGGSCGSCGMNGTCHSHNKQSNRRKENQSSSCAFLDFLKQMYYNYNTMRYYALVWEDI